MDIIKTSKKIIKAYFLCYENTQKILKWYCIYIAFICQFILKNAYSPPFTACTITY